jgi:hypothetical protein
MTANPPSSGPAKGRLAAFGPPLMLSVMPLPISLTALLMAAAIGGCASQPVDMPPGWANVSPNASCFAIAGSYSDTPHEAWASTGWRTSQSLANILLSYRDSPPNLLGIAEPYRRVSIAPPTEGPLSFTLIGNDGGEAPILLSGSAKCDNGVVALERRSTASAEGTTNVIVNTLRLSRGTNGTLVAHTSFEVRHYNFSDPAPRHAWYRFSPVQ